MPSAIIKVSRRFDLPELSASDIFVLYSIAYLPEGIRQSGVQRHAKRMGHPISVGALYNSVNTLSSLSLIHIQDYKLSLAPLGREYLSAIRRYLLNKRL